MSLLSQGMLYQIFDRGIETTTRRLGRNLWLDARSLAYMVENDTEAMFGQPLKSIHWERKVSILDQGNLGSCTGNAGTGTLGTEPFATKLLAENTLGQFGLDELTEDFAVRLYSDATNRDPYAGYYPPDDTGSSGLAVCKVLKTRKTITGYRWARTPHGFARLLQDGPVLVGMPWYNAFFYLERNSYIDADPKWQSSGIAGGHEVEALAIEVDEVNFYSSTIVFANSWGTGWGESGYFRMRMRTYEQLTGVDLKQFIVR
jgi:hypothetical protein